MAYHQSGPPQQLSMAQGSQMVAPLAPSPQDTVCCGLCPLISEEQRLAEQNNLRARGASEWVVQGNGVGSAIATGSALYPGADAIGAAATHDVMAAAYDDKHGTHRATNRARIGHNVLAAGMLTGV